MTVSSSTNKVQYTGNSSTTVFAYTFKIFNQNDLTIIIRSANGTETVKTITTHYTVSGVGSAGGGNITMLTAPVTGETITILREQDLVQEFDLVPNDPFPAQLMEDALDKLTFMVQQHSEELDRSIKASRTNAIGSTEFTVSAADRANKIFGFDGTGELAVTQELGTYRGNWGTATSYKQRDLIKDTSNNNVYICITAHTATGSQPISSNADVAKWALVVDAAAATTSASAAASSASAAATSATNAGNSATAAAGSASAASGSASAAASSASSASTSATNSSNSATASASSAASAAASYDSFDDRYLGAKASNPSLDNDGNALLDGALYFDTTNNVMKVYDLGTAAWLRTTPTSGDQANINTVTGIAANITTVAGISSNVTTVANNDANVTTAATNIAAIIAAPTAATSAATSATNASNSASSASTSATNAAASAASAAASLDSFDDRYLGAKATAPTLDNDGNALLTGALYWNSTSNLLFVRSAGVWNPAAFDIGTALTEADLNVTVAPVASPTLTGTTTIATANITGLLKLPPLSQTAINSIFATAGALVFNATTNAANLYNGTSWVALVSAAFTIISEPTTIFTALEPGAWYDPSDLTTLFQDNIGTTPVTAAGQTVGLMLDKSQGLTLGSELVTNGTFDTDTTGWSASGSTLSVVSGRLRVTAVSIYGNAKQSFATVIGKTYKYSFGRFNGTAGANAIRIGTTSGGSEYINVIVTDETNLQGYFVATSTTTHLTLYAWTTTAGNYSEYDNVTVKLLAGNHATQATSTQRPTYQVDSSGKPYLLFDGVDDGMVTNTITPATDKAQLFAGLRKLSDATGYRAAIEYGNFGSNNGSFKISAPGFAGQPRYEFALRGTNNSAYEVQSYAAPITNILTSIMDIGASTQPDELTPRVNGVVNRTNGNGISAGTGSFGNYTISLGCDNLRTTFFNGRLYSLITRFGATLTSTQITAIENWVNTKTGAF